MSAVTSEAEIVHHPIPGRFVVELQGEQAYLDYEMAGGIMHITHTVVPEAIAGRGVASRLVRAAFDTARQEGWKVRPVCSYADSWAGKHADYSDLLA